MTESEHKRVAEWFRRFTDSLSPKGSEIRSFLKGTDRLYEKGEIKAEGLRGRDEDAKRRLEQLPPEEARNVVRAWKLEPFSHQLYRSPIADDLEDLDLFVDLSHEEQRAAAAALGAGEANTVEEALVVSSGRREAGKDLGEE